MTTDTCPARGQAAGRSAGEGLRNSSVTQECSQNRLLARRINALSAGGTTLDASHTTGAWTSETV